MALTNSMASIKPFLSVSRSLNKAVDSCRPSIHKGRFKSAGGVCGSVLGRQKVRCGWKLVCSPIPTCLVMDCYQL